MQQFDIRGDMHWLDEPGFTNAVPPAPMAAGVVPWNALTARAPLPSCGVAWIEDRHARTGEVFYVARHERQAMFECRGSDHTVSDARQTSDLLTLSV